jgi:broad specificity phosphatase PhoE
VTRLYLVRHGETDWNHERRVQGQSDVPLNEAGRDQALELAERLARVPFDAVYSSDLRRGYETAEIVVAGRSLTVQTLSGLRERNFGRWEGLAVDDMRKVEPARWEEWLTGPRDTAPHGGETDVALESRVVDALTSICARHPSGTILVVSHGGAIRAALLAWLALDVDGTPNCGGYVLEVGDENRRLVDRWPDP